MALHIPTFLAVGLPIFHVEEAVPKGLLARCTHEAGGMPRLPQGMHHFLEKEPGFRTEWSRKEAEVDKVSR